MKTSTFSKFALLILTFLIFKVDSYASTCNWKARTPYFKVWDSCGATGKNKGNIYGYVGFNYSKNSCFKYQWSVNGNNVSSGTTNPRMLQFQPGYNGKYIIRLKVTDTCSNCDTTFTDTATISCLTNKTNTCNWGTRNPKFMLWDSCGSKANPRKINAYIYWNYSIYLQGCFKYYWQVNGQSVASMSSLNRWMTYMPSANGKYTVRLKVVDTCNNCDTTFTDSLQISCLSNRCDWASRKVYFAHWDSCSSAAQSINAYIYFGYNKISCFKYSWTVNGKPTTSLNSNPRSFRYKPTANGIYTVCVKVIDTCDGCDTTICYNDTVKCFTAGMEKTKALGSWQIWPNPTRGVLHISGVSSDLVKYVVTDIKGSALLKGTISNGDDLLDISTLKEGMYFVELQNEIGRKTVPVVYSK